jgi:rubrerythrin
MQTTTEIGINHSGMQVAQEGGEKMLENVRLTKPKSGDEREMAKVRVLYATEADPVGSLPDPDLTGLEAIFMDKLGERLAFERTGARLYDALMAKCRAAQNGGSLPADELRHIRDEEAEHFAIIDAAIEALGGDPTAQTPGADVTGVEGMGLMQVLTDPKTTVAQGLHAILVAEMTDNAAWEELIELAEKTGNQELVASFGKAREQEAGHLDKVRQWYKSATMSSAA